MSRERARRREAREAAAATARARAERRRLAAVRRDRAQRARARRLRGVLGLRPGPSPRLRRASARRWAPVLALLVAAHAVVWLLTDDWALRATAVGVTALAAPVVWVLVTDAGRSRRTGYRRRP